MDDETVTARKAAVLGSPIAHSRSPQLHLAAYRALGLTEWTYDRIECDGERLPGLVSGLGPEWVGLSVTMPGKIAALAFASERTERAVAIGSANTLVRIDGGWRADCTDVDGVSGALTAGGVGTIAGAEAVVVGAGGTARPALVALADMGVKSVTVVARDAGRAAGALGCAESVGLDVRLLAFDSPELGARCAEAAALVSTVPAAAVAGYADVLGRAPFVLDAIYDPWPTPLAAAVEAAGGTVVGGLSMLLHQAFGQVEQFTGRPAPREAMAAALG
ncbi:MULTISPECIES: shikimate dehydrogenase [unclassified Rhodococcus (in: high G+C Gram-positive bacteria)]|uniref:shikimate dehydrogenase n=1 Tax=unclassified Rhodococcus (in: high G+C Gram-positive bacteria) TaxID=192944 RepID=UPI00163B5324|nr:MULTISPECIES: shikimate dehydrogenase [unclassified Rhodococcus (in: high G+C Gram-positive bacteria)]MBC2644034.1 shikimate dehydrogenase [Rhodococcus sp. 3A]MBC2891227.1 shikimate dehydrogenase [Rhodococcus sp. 4CII]